MLCLRAVPTIREILDTERVRPSGEVVLFLEGKFWKAYERSAYMLPKLFGFKPTKRFVKLVGEEVVSEALDRMLEVKLTVRVLHDSKQLSLKSYALLCEQMVAVEKNLMDWKKYHLNNMRNEKTDLF